MAEAQNENRFAHIFSAIKDLAKVWNVDIPQELQVYMEDMEELLNLQQFDKINFAEAALLIQGSTNVYSKRVETLYELVFGVLESIVQNRKKPGEKTRNSKNKLSFLTEEIDHDLLCVVDHLIKTGKNIDIEDAGCEEPLLHRRIPLWLLPREESDRRKHEFKINGCFIHSSGAFLLSESDAMMYEAVDTEEAPYDGEYDISHFINNPPIVPPPPTRQGGDFIPLEDFSMSQEDNQLIGLTESQKKELEEKREKEAEEKREKVEEKEALLKSAIGATPAVSSARPGTPRMGIVTPGVADDLVRKEIDEPFKRLDPHEIIGTRQPLVSGDTSKTPSSIFLMKYSDLIKKKITVTEEYLDEVYFEAHPAAIQAAAGAYLPQCEDLFYNTVPHKPRQLMVPRMGYSTALLPFEEHLRNVAHAAEQERREKMKQHRLVDKENQAEAQPGEGGAFPDEFPDEFDVSDHENDAPDWAPSTDIVLGEDDPQRELRRQQVAQLEAQIEEAQKSYEQLVRNHLDNLTLANDENHRMTGIYKNVRKWQDSLMPLLEEDAKHREFDFQLYGLELLDSIGEKTDGMEGGTKWPFKELCVGMPRFEVCRMFLTSLFLTNQGNLDIEYANNDEIFTFILHLLTSAKNFDALGDEEGRAFAKAVRERNTRQKNLPVQVAGSVEKVEAPAPVADIEAPKSEKRPKRKAAKKRETNTEATGPPKKKR